MDNTAGTKITDIPNREFIQLTTNNAEKIIRGLDMSGILFFAKYNDKSLSLAYDGSRKDSVDEIIIKAESGDYEVIEREYLYDKHWSGKGYGKNGNVLYAINNSDAQLLNMFTTGDSSKLSPQVIQSLLTNQR